MAFTTVSKCVNMNAGAWTAGWGHEAPYFYPEDVAIVMSQPDVVCVQICCAEFNSDDGNTATTLALVGLKVSQDAGGNTIYKRVDHGEALIALSCGRFNKKGGVFKADPEIELGLTIIPVQP